MRNRSLVLFAAAAGIAGWQSAHVKALWDFSYIIEHAYRITIGDIPYKDFFIPHPPLTFLIQAVVLGLSGGSLIMVWAYDALAGGLTAVLASSIVNSQLDDPRLGPPGRVCAAALAAPLVFLNGYAILAMPFYDSDCVLLILIALATLLWARRDGRRPGLSVLAGALLVLPLLAKQNIGLAAFAAIHGTLLLSVVLDRTGRERRAYRWVAVGSVAGLLAAGLVVQLWIGLPEYYHWTVTYAASRRWPRASLLGSLYGYTRTWLTLACAAIGYWLVRRRPATAWAVWLGLAVMALPFAEALPAIVKWGLSARSAGFWALGLIGGVAAAVAGGVRGSGRFEALLPAVAALVVHGAFASQGLADSSYAVWPFLLVGLAAVTAAFLRAAAPEHARTVAAAVVAGSLVFAWLAARHVLRHERLGFADMAGQTEYASQPALRGLATPGTYISDFERLVRRSGALIPYDDPIVVLPGEDPFFFATKRRPQFPIGLFDDTLMPYDRAALMRLLDDRRIEWVVVKAPTQLWGPAWAPLAAFVATDLPAAYAIVEQIPRYTIWKRRH